jgi:hypothetical protein
MTNYAVVGGGSGYDAPAITCAEYGAQTAVIAETLAWVDDGSQCNYGATLPGSTLSERWEVLTPSATVTGLGPISETYYNQYSLGLGYAVSEGSPQPVSLTGVALGSTSTSQYESGTAVWLDAGSQYSLSNPLPSSSSSERWLTTAATSGTLSGPATFSATYYNQFLISATYALVGGGAPTAPVLSYTALGNPETTPLATTSQSFWADAGSRYSAPSQLNGTTSTERWSSSADSGTIQGSTSLSFSYNHQFLLSVAGPGLSSQWYNAGATATLSIPGIYNRTAGAGERVTAYSQDGTAPTVVAPTTGTVTITITMSAAHQLSVSSVKQYQLSLDASATKALVSITKPTISGDDYWYDSGTPVTVTLDGVYGRSGGTGTRLSSYAVNGGPSVVVATTGTVTVLAALPVSSAQSITTTTITEYQLTLNAVASSVLVSCTAPAISGDNYWYDSGTTGVGCTLNGIYGRSGGSGTRVSSYNWDGGANTNEATTGTFTTSGQTMSAAHEVNANTATQYRLSTNSGSIKSLTAPPISGDADWYDTGTLVTVVYNYSWNSTSGQSRTNAIGYTVDQGSPTSLKRAANGSFSVQVTMSASQTIAIQSVAQYQFTVSGGYNVALSQQSPTGDSFYDSGSALTVSTNYTWNIVDGNTRQNLLSYTLDGLVTNVTRADSGTFTTPTIAFTGPHALAFNAVTQYLISFQFKDSTGTHTITPSSFQIQVDDPQIVNMTQSQIWLDNGTRYQIYSAMWEGADVLPTPQTVYTASAPVNHTVADSVYSARVVATDYLGLPLSGAQVSITLANGTAIRRSTSSNGTVNLGLIPLGTFHGSLSYLGTTTSISGDASTQAQTSVKLFASYPTFGLIGVLAAVVLVVSLLAVRRWRAPRSQPSAEEPWTVLNTVCKYCGSEMAPGAEFCPVCGKAQD